MERNQLQAFLKVAELRNFTQAADALYFSQPAVTQQIQALEREVGERLFERQGRRVTLTPAGEAFYPFVSRALALLEEGQAAVGEVRAGVTGRVTMAAGPTTTIFTLPPVLATFREACPRVQLLVQTGTSREVTERVADGRADIGIVTTLYERDDLVHTALFEDEILFVCRGDHALADRPPGDEKALTVDGCSLWVKDVRTNNEQPSTVNALSVAGDGSERLAALVAEPFILFPRGTGFRGYVEQWFAAREVAPRVTMELDSVEAVKVLVEAGLGVAALPRVALREELASGRLAPILITGERPLYRQVYRVLRRGKYVSRPLEALLERLDALRGENALST
jgi:DNA-binding transcriptional LysR family regulator